MTLSSKGLSRGLQSLLATQARHSDRTPSGSIAIEAIRAGSAQPRASMRQESLEELAASIKANGVIQPILVRPAAGAPDHFEIIAGERRWQAARLAGLTQIPAVVRDVSDQEAVALALIENIQREELTPAEEARALQRLIGEFALTHAQAAETVGRSRAAVTNLLRLLDLPVEVIALIDTKLISMGHARALLGLEDDAERVVLARMVAQRGLSVRDTEAQVRKALKPKVLPRESPKAELTAVSDVLATKAVHVRLHQAPSGAGRLTIEFKDMSIRDKILGALLALFEK